MRHRKLAEIIITLIPFSKFVKNLWIDPAHKSFNAVSFVQVEFHSTAELGIAVMFSATVLTCIMTVMEPPHASKLKPTCFFLGFFILGVTVNSPEQNSSSYLWIYSKMP